MPFRADPGYRIGSAAIGPASAGLVSLLQLVMATIYWAYATHVSAEG